LYDVTNKHLLKSLTALVDNEQKIQEFSTTKNMKCHTLHCILINILIMVSIRLHVVLLVIRAPHVENH
jgi:hypothetical protein